MGRGREHQQPGSGQQADLILLGVKPFQVPDLIAEIRPALTKDKTLVSFAASVKTRAIEEAAGLEIAVIRAMPNTPSALGAGAAACAAGASSPPQMELAERIFETVGRTVTVDEKHMDAVTGSRLRDRPTSTSSSRRWPRRA
jgi:pyrroline-5-carboxylate reductase